MALVVVGAACWFRLGVDRFPSVDLPTVTVRDGAAGRLDRGDGDPVAQKLEEQINTIQGIQELRSISSPGNCHRHRHLRASRQIDVAAQDVRDKVAIAHAQPAARHPAADHLQDRQRPGAGDHHRALRRPLAPGADRDRRQDS